MTGGRPPTHLAPALATLNQALEEMNRGKAGRPYQHSDTLILAAFALKRVFKGAGRPRAW